MGDDGSHEEMAVTEKSTARHARRPKLHDEVTAGTAEEELEERGEKKAFFADGKEQIDAHFDQSSMTGVWTHLRFRPLEEEACSILARVLSVYEVPQLRDEGDCCRVPRVHRLRRLRQRGSVRPRLCASEVVRVVAVAVLNVSNHAEAEPRALHIRSTRARRRAAREA